MVKRLEEKFKPIQNVNPPKFNEEDFEEVKRVDLKDLEVGALVLFKGVHPDSRYLLEIEGEEKTNERLIKFWYFGFGASFMGGKGYLSTKAKNITASTKEEMLDEKMPQGILERGKHYTLPEFKWNNKRLYTGGFRMETYKRIQLKR